jgi:FkbM family methyltransferase
LANASSNYYYGLHKYADIVFVLHFLKPGDLVVDVGAFVGSYSLQAAAECRATVIAIEPAPSTFQWLVKNIKTNTLGSKCKLINCAVGNSSAKLPFTSQLMPKTTC